MQKGERFVFTVMVLISVGFASAALMSYYHKHYDPEPTIKGEVIQVPLATAMGLHPCFEGDLHSPYTLVEFGDYECPPCREVNKQLPAVLKRYQGKIRFTFRNLPLVSIHPYAMPAAITAEIAREQGKFWPIHDYLYQIASSNFDDAAIQAMVTAQHLDRSKLVPGQDITAKAEVMLDLEDAKKLGLSSTPSFVICCPDGRIVRIQSLSQIELYIK